MRFLRWMLAVALTSLAAPGAEAGPITFEFSGLASGTLGGVDFAGAPVLFTLTTDIDGVFQPIPNRPNILVTQDTTLGFTVDGVSGTFDDLFHVFRTSFGPNALVGLSPSSGDDLVDVSDPSLVDYDLKSAFGPLTQAPPDFINPGEPYATSRGDLVFRDDPDASLTFRATLGTAVPEPAGLTLMGAGLMILAGYARSRAKSGPPISV